MHELMRVCVCVCVCMNASVVYMFVYVHLCIPVCVSMCVCMCVCVQNNTYMCKQSVHLCMYTCVCKYSLCTTIFTRRAQYIHTKTHTYMQTYIHTHIHTYYCIRIHAYIHNLTGSTASSRISSNAASRDDKPGGKDRGAIMAGNVVKMAALRLEKVAEDLEREVRDEE
jgi:hypothetical protein